MDEKTTEPETIIKESPLSGVIEYRRMDLSHEETKELFEDLFASVGMVFPEGMTSRIEQRFPAGEGPTELDTSWMDHFAEEVAAHKAGRVPGPEDA